MVHPGPIAGFPRGANERALGPQAPLCGPATPTFHPVFVPAPYGFRSAQLPLRRARIDLKPSPISRSAQGNTHARRKGLVYETRVINALKMHLAHLFPSPTLHFVDAGHVWRAAIPDAIHFTGPFDPMNPEGITVFEVKSTHMADAWWQLRKLYQPVLQQTYPFAKINVVEICRVFDPAAPFPEAPKVIFSPYDLPSLSPSDFGVLRWKL